MFKWKAIVLSLILAIILAILLGSIAGTIGSYIGVILTGIMVGYMVNGDIRNGIIHGALVGVIGGVILGILVIILILAIGGTLELLIALGGLISIILTIMLWGIFGAVGGAIGSLIGSRNKEFTGYETFNIIKTENKSQINFNRENMLKCVCPQCGVQKESECAQNKMKMLQISMRGMSPEPSEFPGMYCSNGKAICDDLDPNKMCNCVNCVIWKENDLGSGQPGSYFCQKGRVK